MFFYASRRRDTSCALVTGVQTCALPICRADGWFELDVDCDAGECYRYRLADGLAVPDPASRAQTDDVHGYSRVVDPHAYPWQTPDWRGRPWHETVLYELHEIGRAHV